MGATNAKHPKTTDDLVANQPRRKSIRRSLRFSKSSSKDAMSSTEKYLQSLNEKFDKGVIYHMKVEELKQIETELNAILRDLDNLSAIGITSSKRFELENTTRYSRNKVKAAIENHMDNAIQRLNDSFRIPENDAEEEEKEKRQNKPVRNDLMLVDTQIETDSAKITAKLKEISIKLREIWNFLNTLSEVDHVTRDSSISIVDKCKKELYNLQTKNEKLISKKWKCFLKIDEIMTLLNSRDTCNSIDSAESTCKAKDNRTNRSSSSKEGNEDNEGDTRGIEADVEDNEEKITKNSHASENRDNNPTGKTKGTSSVWLAQAIDRGNLDKINENKLRNIKTTIKNLHSFVMSLDTVEEATKASTEEALNKCKRELRSLRLGNSALSKKRTRRLKEIEELKAILHEKYCEASDEECNCFSGGLDSEPERALKLVKPVAYESDVQIDEMKDNMIEKQVNAYEMQEPDSIPQRRNATIEVTKSKTDNAAFVMTKDLSENFDNTCKKIGEILLRRSASHEDLETLTKNIGEINNQFDGLLKRISSLQEVRDNEDVFVGSPSLEHNKVQSQHVVTIHENNKKHQLVEEEFVPKDDAHISPANSKTENIPLETKREQKAENLETNKDTPNKLLFGKSSPDLLSNTDLNYESKERRNTDSIERKRRQSTPDKKYHQTHSVDELNNSEGVFVSYKRYSEQNLSKKADNSGENLISVRNIDLSQIDPSEGRISTTSELQPENSIASRNIDLSQIVFRQSDISLNRSELNNSFSHAENSSFHAEEYSTEDWNGITITFKSHTEVSSKDELESSFSGMEVTHQDEKHDEHGETKKGLESCLENSGKAQHLTEAENQKVTQSDSEEDENCPKLKEIEDKLEAVKERIMNFVGTKTDNLYNELDEELLEVVINLDSLGIEPGEPLFEVKENIVKKVCKYSGLLEMKNLDCQYLDSFEKEVKGVEREIRQSLAKEKFDNLRHIMLDIDDMLGEIQNKIVDHLLVERRDTSIKRLNSIKDKLVYLTK